MKQHRGSVAGGRFRRPGPERRRRAHISKSDSFELRFELARFRANGYTHGYERTGGIGAARWSFQTFSFSPARSGDDPTPGAIHGEGGNEAFDGRCCVPYALRRYLPGNRIPGNLANLPRVGRRL